MEMLSNRLKNGWIMVISDGAELLDLLRHEIRDVDHERLVPLKGWEIMLLRKSNMGEWLEERNIIPEALLCMHITGMVADNLLIEFISSEDDGAIDGLLQHIMKGREKTKWAVN